jgi:hypothetical protein
MKKIAKHVGRNSRVTCNHIPLEGVKLTMIKGKRNGAFIEIL